MDSHFEPVRLTTAEFSQWHAMLKREFPNITWHREHLAACLRRVTYWDCLTDRFPDDVEQAIREIFGP